MSQLKLQKVWKISNGVHFCKKYVPCPSLLCISANGDWLFQYFYYVDHFELKVLKHADFFLAVRIFQSLLTSVIMYAGAYFSCYRHGGCQFEDRRLPCLFNVFGYGIRGNTLL